MASDAIKYTAKFGYTRFVSRDSIEGDSIWPISFQKFLYVANNPLDFVDPSGMLRIRLNVPHYSQLDYPKFDSRGREIWANRMKKCGASIAAKGCLLTCATMVFAYYGSNMLPDDVNVCMGKNACPWVYDTGAISCSQGMAVWEGNFEPTFTLMRREIAGGHPVIIEVPGHFVVLNEIDGEGNQASDYWVIDPAGGVRKPLSRWSDFRKAILYYPTNPYHFRPPICEEPCLCPPIPPW